MKMFSKKIAGSKKPSSVRWLFVVVVFTLVLSATSISGYANVLIT